VAEFIYESTVFCSACTMSSLRKFTFAISSPDEFLVLVFRCVASFENQMASERLRCQIFAFSPVNISGKVGDMFESVFRAAPIRLNERYTFDA